MWTARMGVQWRHLTDNYGKWNSVFRRYRRWVATGVFDAMLKTPAEAVERNIGADMIDSTVVQAHHCAVELKKGLEMPRRSDGRAAASPPTLLSLPKGSTLAATVKAGRSASS